MSVDPTRIEIAVNPMMTRMRGVATHGNTPFDVPYISNIASNLWQGGCSDGMVVPSVIQHIVSLYPWERYHANHDLRSELYFRMYDSTQQTFDQVDELARYVNARRATGPVLVHCQAGLNRSSLIAARALVLEGMSPKDAIALIRVRRSPACLCNPAFEQWLLQSA